MLVRYGQILQVNYFKLILNKISLIGFGFGTDSEFGTSNDEIRCNLIKAYHSKGINVLISAFGAAEWPTGDAKTIGQNLGQFAVDNLFDGVDVDYENNDALFEGTGEQWLIDL